jgi:ATP-binding cassette subfamily B protein
MTSKYYQRRFLAPEVVQTSATDCGPATLACLLQGFGVSASYGRLREACQTDVDGTSIDTVEQVADQTGLEVEQVMLPADHLLLEESAVLPAIVVVQQPNGLTHFVVVWRCVGPLVQVMDPGVGRRWITRKRFLEEVYVHSVSLPASDWRHWAGSEQFLDGLRKRLQNLKAGVGLAQEMIDQALNDPGWRGLGALDAAVRMVSAVFRSGGLQNGSQSASLVRTLFDDARNAKSPVAPTSPCTLCIPGAYWSVQPGDGEGQNVTVQGVVMVRVLGRKDRRGETRQEGATNRLSPELAAALAEAPSRPGRKLWVMLGRDGLLPLWALLGTLALVASGLVIEAVLFQGLFEVGRDLNLTGQRLAGIGAVCFLALALLLLELPLATSLFRLGRRLEARLRLAFLQKIPKLVDRYFQSRLTSDMAERSHTIHYVRQFPWLGGSFIRSCFELAFTAAALIWLDPRSAPLAILAALSAVGLPLLLNPILIERDLRVRTHAGALTRFYLDALLGLVAVRAHGAETALRSEQEGLIAEWVKAGLGLQRAAVIVQGLQSFVGFGLAAWLLFAILERRGQGGTVLLAMYWALNLPALGNEIALLARQYPAQRNVTQRLLEPLGAPEVNEMQQASSSSASSSSPDGVCMERGGSGSGVAIAMENVSVIVSGHTILDDLNVRIEPGSHIAIVGVSGAGKSSLVGLLLGWHRAATGRVLVDGQILDASRLTLLRRQTGWVDPAVQLWNRSLLENLNYGAPTESVLPFAQATAQADLVQLLEKLPDGFQNQLGEGGGLLSGGEAQRVRFGRSLLRPDVQLVILDEPFRGLDREQRRELLARAREVWKNATLLCVTHDVGETQSFPRVLVVEQGRISQDGSPQELLAQPGSRYAALLQAEIDVRQGLWSGPHWRKLRLEDGTIMNLEQQNDN